MNANWFEAGIKYIKVNEDGRERKVKDLYLLDAMSYTEAEGRIMKEMESVIQGEYYITNLKKSNITEVVPSNDENDDRWYKAKIALIDADEVSGKETISKQNYLVAGADIERAQKNLEESLKTFVIPYEIVSISDTKFLDVFPYFSNEENIPENLKPLDQEQTGKEGGHV